ncbi:hypothetical protein [Shewanella pneumatophori]|uniref:Capsule polysaccharide biosynthesis protein n=1 Tax=Shewanella pneumatophori TaxID=314092 RepID=A0A9X1ZHI0_9GAMM|nr:hypothetical protein [Shewanella pneumatophori]MCL1139585.1 hypothetical protein [Shewanella pneumatophori]
MLKKIINKLTNRVKRSISNRNIIKRFSINNRAFWDSAGARGEVETSKGSEKVVLVEISEKNPFELESNMRVAKSIERNTSMVIEALVACTFKFREPYVNLVESYNISKSITLYALSLVNIFRLTCSLFEGLNLYWKIKSLDDIESIKYEGILIGDLIYDTYIRMLDGKYSPNKDFQLFKYIVTAIFNYKIVSGLFDEKNVGYVIVADKCYLKHGVLYRVAIERSIKVLMPTKELKYLHKDNIKTHFYHPEISLEKMELDFKGIDIESEVALYFDKRFSGEINQIDVLTSYRNKRVYSSEELITIMSLDRTKKNVIIMPHAFSDFPHIAEGLYNDYYVWLVELLKMVKDIHNVNWLIKPHPTSYVFNEIGVVESLLNDLGASNVKVVPKDMNTASVKDIADVILTVRGTPGLEFATFGIPVVTAGKGCYSGYGIDIEAATKQDYFKIINNLDDVYRLDDIQIRNAKMVFYYLFIKLNAKLDYLMDDIENNMSDYNRVLDNILRNNDSERVCENVLYKSTLAMLNKFN